MRATIARLRSTLTAGDSPEEQSETVLYECTSCRSMIMNPASDRCSQCESGTLARR